MQPHHWPEGGGAAVRPFSSGPSWKLRSEGSLAFPWDPLAQAGFLHAPLTSCRPQNGGNGVQDPMKLSVGPRAKVVLSDLPWATLSGRLTSLSLPRPAAFPLGQQTPWAAGPLISCQGSLARVIKWRQRGWLGPWLWTPPPPPGRAAVRGRSRFRWFPTLHFSHLFKGWSPCLVGSSAQLPVKLIRFAAVGLIQQL